METPIKQLKTGQIVFFPQTVAEAVVVNTGSKIITLNDYLKKKTIVTVNSKIYTSIQGSEDQNIQFGDDFKIDENNNITLTWNGTT